MQGIFGFIRYCLGIIAYGLFLAGYGITIILALILALLVLGLAEYSDPLFAIRAAFITGITAFVLNRLGLFLTGDTLDDIENKIRSFRKE